MSIIIKNCPVCEFSDWEECTGYLAEGYICNDIHTEIVECKDRTDCKLKQIVELCRKENIEGEKLASIMRLSDKDTKEFLSRFASNKILELLDMQEILE